VSVLKGHLAIHASPGCGTEIGVRLPLIMSRRQRESVFKSE
jgi:hypothetical protein